ncbi:uncharacterized protein [Diabrotica undecimpunctata]|uniref:uncharacterized protein n=1 Tax=Diabrotica undecimpunctata TaxID=50387 RepID=UPI003B631D84
MIVYVDDIILTGHEQKIKEAIDILKNNFCAKDLGEVKNFLGITISRESGNLTLGQPKMISKILSSFGMSDCKGAASPMETNFQIDNTLEVIDVPYRKLIGSLMYISTTSRPDIMFAVSYLSRVLDKPSQQTWKAGKRVLRYLKETQNFSLTYKKKPWELVCYSDSDWASNKIDRKSITGCIVFYCGNPVSWLSQKQNCCSFNCRS